MGSSRLPGKPLADIHGMPMIAHVLQGALASGLGPVVVACDDARIAEAVTAAGGQAVLTCPDHPSGSDRIWDALTQLPDGGDYDAIINVQGDLPLIDPAAITRAWELLADPAVDIATLAVPIADVADIRAPQIVKAVFDYDEKSSARPQGRALYFSRQPVPSGVGALYHHVGLYAYRRAALEKFVTSPPTPLEKRESLEQLRALSLGLHIEVGLIDTVPLGVDTPADLERVRGMLEAN